MTFTEAQEKAITYRKGSVLVSAGAGSGKTRVITERIMEYIDPRLTKGEPEDINRFLIITFTRAAAGELRARIAGAIAERLYADPGNAHLRRQMVLVRNAQIETIHSFCGTILREYAAQIGISPAFRILEDERRERMLVSALERVLEQSYESGEEGFLRLADSVGAGRDDSRLAELALKLYHNMQSHADPDCWIDRQKEELHCMAEDIGETIWGRELLQNIRETVSFWAEEMERSVAEMIGNAAVCRAYESSFRETAASLRNLETALNTGWDTAFSCFPVKFPKIGSIKDSDSQKVAEKLKTRRNNCRDAMRKMAEKVFTGKSDTLIKRLRETAPEMQALLELCTRLDAEYMQSKRRNNYLDFSDLEHLALRLLTDENGKQTEAAKQVADRFEEIMVDEYQDVSRVQDSIFHAVSRDGGNLFFVGDIKQSIYRFRLADPGIFTEKSRDFGTRLNSRGDCLIHLQENFRSREEVLAAVNDVFGRCMSEQLGEINYDESEELRTGAAYPENGARPELLLLRKDRPDSSLLEDEAEMVGQVILKMIGACRIRGENGLRNLRFGDIAILLRSANTDGGVFRRKLLQMGIPVAAGAGGDFFNSVEISTVFAMLQLIDNPHRDIPLLTVLSSPAFGFTPDQLSMIRAANPDTDYYTALEKSETVMAREFLQKLSALRAEAPDLDPVRILDRVIEDLNLREIIGAMADGELRLRHLEDLIAMGESFQRTGERGLYRLVRWLDYLRNKGGIPQSSTDDADTVRIMSIHKSKGLEFPVVFYSALGKQFNMRDTTNIVLMHPTLGLGPKHTDNLKKVEYPTVARQAIANKLAREVRSEEMRLMYVAMTRAKERLIMTACIKKPDDQIKKAEQLLEYDKIPAPLLQSAASPLPWVLPAALHGETLSYRVLTLSEFEKKVRENENLSEEKTDNEMEGFLNHRLSFHYPYRHAENLPSKLTAAALDNSRTADEDAVDISRYSMMRKDFEAEPIARKDMKATERGTAVHLVLQHIAYEKTGDMDGIKDEIRRLTQNGFLSAEAAESVNPEMIIKFFSSELGKRLLHAEQIWREFRFSLLCNAKDLIPGENSEDQILLQGAVDCCFLENGRLVLADYKTDHISEQLIPERKEHYRRQMETYAMALERIMRLPVKERILYFLYPGIAVSV